MGLPSPGEEYWVEGPSGEQAFLVNGPSPHAQSTVRIEGPQGQALCTLRAGHRHKQDSVSVDRNSMSVDLPDGSRLALVHQALVSPFQRRWKVDVKNGEQLTVQGNIADHEYTVEEDGNRLAMISKRWFRSRDAYGVQVTPGGDPGLVLAIAVALDVMNPGE